MDGREWHLAVAREPGHRFSLFRALKFVPSFSPAEELASATIAKLTLGMVEPRTAVGVLAVCETAVGVALVFGVQLRIAIGLLFVQMAGTLTPLALFPSIHVHQVP